MDKSVLYDRLYVMASKVLERHSPCQSCKACEYFGGNKAGCCEGCPFLSPTGCTTQSLGCKFWLCGDASRHSHFYKPIVLRHLRRLKDIADRHGIDFARATKEEALSVADKYLGLNYHHPDDRKWYFYYTRNRGPYA